VRSSRIPNTSSRFGVIEGAMTVCWRLEDEAVCPSDVKVNAIRLEGTWAKQTWAREA
jgi:hypothetical protein